jgi:hypothetical protein
MGGMEAWVGVDLHLIHPIRLGEKKKMWKMFKEYL